MSEPVRLDSLGVGERFTTKQNPDAIHMVVDHITAKGFIWVVVAIVYTHNLPKFPASLPVYPVAESEGEN